jgi:hypothetical protein
MTPADQQRLRDRVHERLAVYSRVAEAAYKDGHRECLWLTIEYHILTGQPSPAWVRTALITSYEAGTKNWDDLFGEYPRTKHGKEEEMVAEVAYRMRSEGPRSQCNTLFS